MDRRRLAAVWPWRSRWRPLHGAAGAQVDDATLLKPRRRRVVGYGRDYAETHHSPLTQIDQTQRRRLGVAWSVEVGSEGKIETTPMVFNGVLYGTSTWSVVYAVDLRTGTLKWRWDPGLVRGGFAPMGPRPCCGPVNRGVALYNGKVYVGLLDGRLVALDARDRHVRCGRCRRRRPDSDYTHHRRAAHRQGQGRDRATAAPSTACAASSPPTTPRPASRRGGSTSSPAIRRSRSKTRRWRGAAKTWNGEWWKYGGGGTPWDGIAYDPELESRLRRHRQRLAVERATIAAPAAATTCICPRSSRSTPTPASTSGTTRRRPATTGTTTPRSR